MSEQGKLKRGEALYNFRDINGNLPLEITRDAHKMEEVKFFLAQSVEVKEKKPVKEAK